MQHLLTESSGSSNFSTALPEGAAPVLVIGPKQEVRLLEAGKPLRAEPGEQVIWFGPERAAAERDPAAENNNTHPACRPMPQAMCPARSRTSARNTPTQNSASMESRCRQSARPVNTPVNMSQAPSQSKAMPGGRSCGFMKCSSA
jgi:hypothetical protein